MARESVVDFEGLRRPVAAGAFYPADPGVLVAELPVAVPCPEAAFSRRSGNCATCWLSVFRENGSDGDRLPAGELSSHCRFGAESL